MPGNSQHPDAALREQILTVEALNRIARRLAVEMDTEQIVQLVTDESTQVTGAAVGAFFYNVVNGDGESYMLYTISGAPREAFEQFPMPRNTAVFQPTFSGEAIIRLDDVTQDPRFGQNAPFHGFPPNHLPVKSYLAVPVISRNGDVLGGLFLGHPDPGKFTANHDFLMHGIAAQAAIAMDNARLYEETQESEERFRQLADHVEDVFWLFDPAAERVLYVNPAFERVWGFSREQLYAERASFVRSIQPHDRQAFEEFCAKQNRGENAIVEYQITRPDGSTRWIWDRAFPIRHANGEVYRIAGIAEDVTDRKQSERAARFFADASATLSTVVDYESTLQKVAGLAVPAFADWCAVDLVENDGSLRRLAVVHVDPAKIRIVEDLAEHYPPNPDAQVGPYRVLRTGRAEFVAEIPEEMLRSVAHDDRHYEILASLQLRSFLCVPLQTRDTTLGVITFVYAESGRRYGERDLAFATELSRRASIAIENARLYADLRDADRRKNEFLAMLAHELRNPLAPIRSGLEILAMTSGDEREIVGLMQQQVDHLARLVEDLLDVARIIRGRIELRKERIPIQQVLERSVAAVRPGFEEQKQPLSVHMGDSPIWVDGDAVRLTQVVENLLTNAMKYSDQGQPVELSAELREQHVVIAVQDRGIGMDSELLPVVFDLFTQSKRTLDRSQGGLGIGLTLVRNLVEMHDGTVSAYSAGPGQGSRFEVTLPLSQAGQSEETDESPGASATGRRVLIVDDNVGAAKMLSLLVGRLGSHEIAMAHDGYSAIEEAHRFQPEIIFLDIGLPYRDGFAVAWTLREQEMFQDTFIIALTGYGREEDRRRSREAGFDEHLVKPVDIQTLKRLLIHPKLSGDRESGNGAD